MITLLPCKATGTIQEFILACFKLCVCACGTVVLAQIASCLGSYRQILDQTTPKKRLACDIYENYSTSFIKTGKYKLFS